MLGSHEGRYAVFMTWTPLVVLASLGVAPLARGRWPFTPDGPFRSPTVSDVGWAPVEGRFPECAAHGRAAHPAQK